MSDLALGAFRGSNPPFLKLIDVTSVLRRWLVSDKAIILMFINGGSDFKTRIQQTLPPRGKKSA